MHRSAWRELLVLRPGKEGIGLAHQPVDNEADPLFHSRVEVVQGLGVGVSLVQRVVAGRA